MTEEDKEVLKGVLTIMFFPLDYFLGYAVMGEHTPVNILVGLPVMLGLFLATCVTLLVISGVYGMISEIVDSFND
jgi:hypothetical protein